MSQWDNGIFYLNSDGQIPTLSQNEINNLDPNAKGSCFFNSTDGLLYTFLNGEVLLANQLERKKVYISLNGNDATGKLGNPYYHFRTFMGAKQKIMEANYNRLQGFIFQYVRTHKSNIHTENDMDFSDATSQDIIYIDVPYGVTIQSDSDNDTPIFNVGGYQYIVLTGKGSFIRTGNPTTTTATSLANNWANIQIFGANEIINYVGLAINNPNHLENINLIESKVSTGVSTPRGDIKNIKKIKCEGTGIYRPYGNITNCEIESETGHAIKFVEVNRTIKNCKLITNNNTMTIGYNAGTLSGITRFYNCDFINNIDNTGSYNISSVLGEFALYDCNLYVNTGLQNIYSSGMGYVTYTHLKNVSLNKGITNQVISNNDIEISFQLKTTIVVGAVLTFSIGGLYGIVGNSFDISHTVLDIGGGVPESIETIIDAFVTLSQSSLETWASYFTYSRTLTGNSSTLVIKPKFIGSIHAISYADDLPTYLYNPLRTRGIINLLDLYDENKEVKINKYLFTDISTRPNGLIEE